MGVRRKVVALLTAIAVVAAVTVALWAGASAVHARGSALPMPTAAAGGPLPPFGTESAAPLGAGDHQLTVWSGGMQRSFILHVPPRLAASDHPALVLVFHGAQSTDTEAEQQTGLDAVSDADHFLVVYPQGYNGVWNEAVGNTPAAVADVNDVAFTSALIADVEHFEPVDKERVEAVGFSNGGVFVNLLGCRLAGVIRVIVPIEGPLLQSVANDCSPSAPLSVLEVHGTADPVIPYGGATFPGLGGGTVLSAPSAISWWARADRCTQSATTSSSTVTVKTYEGCAGGATVSLRSLVGGQHEWPPGVAQLVASALPPA